MPTIEVTGGMQAEKKDNWDNRSAKMKCFTCMSFVPKDASISRSGPLTDIGRCRRHAPTMGGFPVVFGTDWCGDHKLDENKV